MRRLVPLALLFVCLFSSSSALAQQARFTWLRFHNVAAGQDAQLRSMYDRVMAGQKVVGWGIAVPLTHTGDPWTHVVYVAFADWASADAFAKATESAGAFPVGMDVILNHIVQAEVPPKARPKYIGVDTYVVKQGRAGDAISLFNEWGKPLFSAAAEKGRIGTWGFSTQSSIDDYTHMIWYFMSDLAAIDDLVAGSMSLDPMKLRGYEVRLRDLSEPEKYRTQLLRIVQSSP